jgi:tRNA pseudouridine-54 N-methylase
MADAAALERSPFAALPHALFVKVLLLLPADARAACATVCKGWQSTLDDATLWTRLDVSPESGVAPERVTEAVLRGTSGKARGGLTALDVSECRLTHEALLEVLAANAGALTELRASRALLGAGTVEQVEALLGAAPLLRVCDPGARLVAAAAACRMLRNEPPFGPLRLHFLSVQQPWPGGDADVHAFAADLTASASQLSHLMLADAPLGTLGALDALVDAALARRLPTLALSESSLSATSVPALARLLSGTALTTLYVTYNDNVTLLQSGPDGSAALLAAALRANSTLKTLALICARVWHNAAAGETLLHALTAHASIRYLHLDGNDVRAADRARVGASLGALVAANASALQFLNVTGCALGDEGLGPLVDALAANTHMQDLNCTGNGLSEAFALERLQPALLANSSLCKLKLVDDDEQDAASPALRQMEQLVAQRAAARAAQRAAV